MENTNSVSILEVFLNIRSRVEAAIFRRVRCRMTTSDLLQDTFLRLWERRDSISQTTDLAGYFVMTGRNLAIDHERRLRIAPFVGGIERLEEIAEIRPSAEDALIGRQELRRLAAAVDRLPPRARQVFLLTRMEGLTYAQVGARLGISPKTAFNHMVTALERLKAELQIF